MPEETYEFEDLTYERLDAAGIRPLSVLDVLHGSPRVRRHIGAAMQIAGRDRAGTWIVVALIERGGDDRYTVTGARQLDADEIAAIAKMMEGDQS
ncbi:hypothetical protein [Polymorphospora sp. NPDC050346]|uniref:hypothetical protein n=1 Tax=Polymorphospora sp. NPDC050346 TaxID=3155780 RepID=UPI0034078BAF